MRLLRLNAEVMAKPSYSQDDPPRVKYTGEGLASVLAYMALNNPQGFEDLVAVARTLIPRLRRIRFRKATVYRTESEVVRFGKDTVNRSSRRPYQGEMILLDFEHAENVSARTASEGTILMLGLIDRPAWPRPAANPVARRHRARSAPTGPEADGRSDRADPSRKPRPASAGHGSLTVSAQLPESRAGANHGGGPGRLRSLRTAHRPLRSSRPGKRKWPRARCGACSERNGWRTRGRRS